MLTKQQKEQRNQRITELMAKHGQLNVMYTKLMRTKHVPAQRYCRMEMERVNGRIVAEIVDE